MQSFAGVAQLAEQLICNQQVAGSSPIAGFLLVRGWRLIQVLAVNLVQTV